LFILALLFLGISSFVKGLFPIKQAILNQSEPKNRY
jgi:hypothetical protein